MLQQTQVSRVLVKYPQFIQRFSTFGSLAKASITDILTVWQGMGYNRRALYLKKAAAIIINQYKGVVPNDSVTLDTLPGIGEATASSIVTFTYNKPSIFIETNIRRVFIHHFFKNKENVDDKHILLFVRETLDNKKPKEWYWALMDYGSYLGKKIENPNKKSKYYAVQSQFEGSDRQIRGKILKVLLAYRRTEQEIIEELKITKKRVKSILASLEKEGFIETNRGVYALKN